MNARENFVSRIRMEPSEYTPIFLRDLTLALDAINIPTTDVFGNKFNSHESARAVLAFQRMTGQDAVVGTINTYSVQAFGGDAKYPEWGIPYQFNPPFEDISRMDLFEPSDIDDELLRGMAESYSIVRSETKDIAMVLNVGGPVNTAGNLRGVEQFMMDTEAEPDIAKKLTKFSEGVMKTMIDVIAEKSDPDAVFLACASDNPDMMGVDGFRKFSLPHVKNITDHVHSAGLPVIFHPHGIFSTDDRKEILQECVDTRADGFQFAESNDPEGILEITKGRCSVLGGVNAHTTLLLGPDERIVRDTYRFMDTFKNEDYVLMCSCSIHRGLPIQNVKTMVDSVRKYEGRMDLIV